MNPDILFAAVMFIGLLIFYFWNEPKARQQDEKRRQEQPQGHGPHIGLWH